MKQFNFLALCLFLSVGFLQAQTFQNTTATTAVDGITRSTGCGFGVQPGVDMSDITVTTTGIIGDPSKITVSVALTSGWLGDVVLELVSPEGFAITLIRRIGANANSSCGDSSTFIPANILSFNSDNTLLIPAAAIASSQPIPGGNYAPTYGAAKFPIHHPGNMATFLTGKTLNGAWRLIVYDYGFGEPTTLNSWQIQVGTGAVLRTSEVGAFGSVISLKQNPVDDFLLLEINKNNSGFETLELEVYDITGKLVINEKVENTIEHIKIDATHLTSGIYLLVPKKDGERTQSIKFIKN